MADTAKEQERAMIRKWLRRTVFVILLIIVFASVPFILDAVGVYVAGGDWDAFTESWFGARGAAQVFLAGFATIVVIIIVMMYFILNIFSSDEGGW
ncbi:MAG: hypothetical protein ACW98Y_20095 [Candidatus Thorarchaeota archaeon]